VIELWVRYGVQVCSNLYEFVITMQSSLVKFLQILRVLNKTSESGEYSDWSDIIPCPILADRTVPKERDRVVLFTTNHPAD
jgi:hypothetical protein